MRNRQVRRRAAVAAATAMTTAAIVLAVAAPAGANACTPGFFKNHTQFFTPTYTTTTTLAAAFGPLVYPPLANDTLLTALSYKGGTDIDGANRIMLRAASAAILNADNTAIGTLGADYALTDAWVLWYVNLAYTESNYRDGILTYAYNLDAYNNSGNCSLGGLS
jgi:hypothetical protein